MKTKRICLSVLILFTSGLLFSASDSRRFRSDKDLSKVGNRTIVHENNSYSPQEEVRNGNVMSAGFEKSVTLVVEPDVLRDLAILLDKIVQHSDVHTAVTLKVVDSDDVYANTLMGGHIYVSRGLLLKVENEAQLACVLSRELAHVALHSAAREIRKEMLAQLTSIPLIGSSADIQGAGHLSQPLASLRFKQEAELDADFFGAQYFYLSGYEPEAFIETVIRLWQNGVIGSASPALEPRSALDERVKALKEEISRFPPRTASTVGRSAIDLTQFQARLRSWKAAPKN